MRGWPLRLLAVFVAAISAVMAYMAISLWVIRDVAVRAAHLAEVPVADLLGTQRHYGGAVLTLVAAAGALVGAVLLMRSVAGRGPMPPDMPRRRRSGGRAGAAMSERAIWDALDEGATTRRSGQQGSVIDRVRWRRYPSMKINRA